MAFRDLLQTKTVFRKEDIPRYVDKPDNNGKKAYRTLLDYHVRKGNITVLRKGLYAGIPAGVDPDSFIPDPLLVAANMTDDAVLGYHTALEAHGRAHSVFNQYFYLSKKSPELSTVRSTRFRRVRHRSSLLKADMTDFGVVSIYRSGEEIRVTGFERTLVDCFDNPRYCGSWEEIWTSLELIEFFDTDDVLEYLRLLDNRTTAAKVAYFLDENRERLMVDEVCFEQLEQLCPKQPHYLDRTVKGNAELQPRWNLIVPEYVQRKMWEEPR